MSLFGSIRLASNALRADQIALQVVGQNIANANTPGYIREEVELSPAPTQRVGGLLMGLGVQVDAVVQKIDRFLEERLRGAVSDKSSAETRESTYTQLEQLIGELSNTDISTAMTSFFNSISEILNQPEDISVRNMAVLNANTLTQEIRGLSERVSQVRSDLNEQVKQSADDINRLTEEIRSLNVRIAATEGGDVSKSDAVGLRDQRLTALEDLAKLINIQVKEQPSGTVTVYTGGDYLVAEGVSRPVKVVLESDRGLNAAYIHVAETDLRLEPSGGELHGLLTARDNVLGGFLDKLDNFAGTLAFEFNKIYSSGQGLNGYTSLTSQAYVTDPDSPLDNAGLAFTPTNGSFQVLVHDKEADVTHTTDVRVNLNGVDPDTETSLNGLAAQLNQIDGMEAQVTSDGQLTIRSTSASDEFSFANDTSGVLAALGINTFFTGSTAHDLNVNPMVKEDPAKFAASQGGIGVDTQNAVELAAFPDQAIASQNGASISALYDRMVGEATEGSTAAKAVADGARTFEQTLRGQQLAVSGVSIDEEAIQMIAIPEGVPGGGPVHQHAQRSVGHLGQSVMAIIGIPSTRISDLFSRQVLLQQVQTDQMEMLRLETQLSTGYKFQLPSEDPVAALRVMSLQQLLERKDQIKSNLTTNQSYLSATDSAMSQISGMVAEIRGGRSGRDRHDRRRHAAASRRTAGSAGPAATDRCGEPELPRPLPVCRLGNHDAPFSSVGANLVRYDGNERRLESYGNVDLLFDTNSQGNEVFGAISDPVRGTVDLNPVVTRDTRLADLRGGRGIHLGSIAVSDGDVHPDHRPQPGRDHRGRGRPDPRSPARGKHRQRGNHAHGIRAPAGQRQPDDHRGRRRHHGCRTGDPDGTRRGHQPGDQRGPGPDPPPHYGTGRRARHQSHRRPSARRPGQRHHLSGRPKRRRAERRDDFGGRRSLGSRRQRDRRLGTRLAKTLTIHIEDDYTEARDVVKAVNDAFAAGSSPFQAEADPLDGSQAGMGLIDSATTTPVVTAYGERDRSGSGLGT